MSVRGAALVVLAAVGIAWLLFRTPVNRALRQHGLAHPDLGAEPRESPGLFGAPRTERVEVTSPRPDSRAPSPSAPDQPGVREVRDHLWSDNEEGVGWLIGIPEGQFRDALWSIPLRNFRCILVDRDGSHFRVALPRTGQYPSVDVRTEAGEVHRDFEADVTGRPEPGTTVDPHGQEVEVDFVDVALTPREWQGGAELVTLVFSSRDYAIPLRVAVSSPIAEIRLSNLEDSALYVTVGIARIRGMSGVEIGLLSRGEVQRARIQEVSLLSPIEMTDGRGEQTEYRGGLPFGTDATLRDFRIGIQASFPRAGVMAPGARVQVLVHDGNGIAHGRWTDVSAP